MDAVMKKRGADASRHRGRWKTDSRSDIRPGARSPARTRTHSSSAGSDAGLTSDEAVSLHPCKRMQDELGEVRDTTHPTHQSIFSHRQSTAAPFITSLI